MAEGRQRSLRVRRPPVYFGADNQDGQHIGYARQPYPKEYVSPAQQLNSLGKLMAKFVNSVNKHYRQSSKDNENQQRGLGANEEQIVDKAPKKSQASQQGSKKKQNQKTDNKDDGQKQSKQLYSYKDQILSKEILKNQQNGLKEPNNKKNNQNKSNFDTLNKQQFSLINQSKTPEALVSMLQWNKVSGFDPRMSYQQLQPNTNPFSYSRQTNNKQKIFGRASYHVAIAYHIYINKAKQKKIDPSVAQSQFDPTYYAKRLKNGIQSLDKTNQHCK